DPAGQALEEPDVAHRAGQLAVSHSLAPHLGLGDLGAALVADHAAVLHALVLATEALPVRDGPEDLRAEEPIPLRLEGPIVDGLGLGELAWRPGPALLRAGQADLDRVEVDQHPSHVNVRPHGHHQAHSSPLRLRFLASRTGNAAGRGETAIRASSA